MLEFWEIDGKKMYLTSIQEEIAQVIQPYFKSKDYKFHSGGREDIDVRMLGGGRPFCFELIDPRRTLSVKESDLVKMAETINLSPDVNVRELHFSDDSCFEKLKESECEKIKAYCCIVYSKRLINQNDIDYLNSQLELKLNQRTPLRVLHRRTLMIRWKMIHKLKATLINEHFMTLYVLAAAGTYIKEFVHGDLERTVPNLGQMLKTDCDILQLDVIKLYEKLDENVLHDFMNIVA